MRAVFGVVALLIVLAVVGGVAVKQMRASSQAMGNAAVQAAPPGPIGHAVPAAPAGNVREQSQQLQQRVRDDVSRALEQGSTARQAAADK